MRETFRVGARDSQLSLLQAQDALKHLAHDTGCAFDLVPFSSPGDRDQRTDLRNSPEDFFTRDLDDALRAGAIDCAIHSAKDMPETLQTLQGEAPSGAPELDWFWLPWREDPRDCLVARTPEPAVIGVSSERRAKWAAERFPKAECRALRGAIPERLAQLDAGKFDAILVAAAALHRLGLQARITEYIPLSELTPPPGQGVLALTFRRADVRFQKLRSLYIKAVRFVGAGVGDAELCTLAGLRELRQADCVIYDALMDPALLQYTQGETLYVGKRSGAHALAQSAITRLIGERVRRGERVVRLKGGDPGIFGRLAEETDALAADGIPFRVVPGISALTAATTSTGMLLTRRGESKGFHVETPRSTGNAMPSVFFMALESLAELATRFAPETPCAIVCDAGAPTQRIFRGTLRELAASAPWGTSAGLVIVGKNAERAFPQLGAFGGMRIWVTGSPDVAEKARTAITDFGGTPVVRPLIRFEATARVKIRPSKAYTHLLITSPTAARMFLRQMENQIQFVPKRLIVTGAGTAEVLKHWHVDTLMPESDFSSKGLLATLPADLTGMRILRVRSEEAGTALADALKARGAKVKDLPIYKTIALPEVEPPPHDAVFLASSSAARAWLSSSAPREVDVLALGNPTAQTLREHGVEPKVVAPVQTVQELFFAYACARLN